MSETVPAPPPQPTSHDADARDAVPRSPLGFRIVGIGASAGGLEAIVDLLDHLPADGGMALLVVQHLDPSRRSALSEIFSKHTTMATTEATDGMVIEADHLYVIPPNTSMLVVQGHLQLRPRRALGPPMPVDDLFESLAKDQGPSAIGIVLSGSGTDGAIGLQFIKDCGGVTFAQDEASARFSSMPRAAIGLGCVDLVLPPASIAEHLVRVLRHPHLATESPPDAGVGDLKDEAVLLKLFRQLRSACNIDFSHYKRGTVERRLSRRLALHSLDSVSAYLQVIDNDPGEAHALCRDLLIRYTEFFRDPEAFEALAEVGLPRLLQSAPPNTPIRVWVPGCSTGEEVYSLAICLTEYLTSRSLPNGMQLFGTDISEDALDTARAGRYIENIARNVSAERLHRYFTRDGDHYRVAKAIRDCCTFARQNVAYDPPFSRIDLISCRNLLIYLDPVLQKRVMPAFHFALQRDGVLMLGQSESAGMHSDLFAVLDSNHGKLFTKRPVSVRPYSTLPLFPMHAIARNASAESPASLTATAKAEAASANPPRDEIDRIALARYVPACVLCDEAFNAIEFRGDTSPFLAMPPGPPTNQLQRLSRPGVFVAVSEAIRQVRREGVPVRKSGLRIEVAGQPRDASVDVMPVPSSGTAGPWYLVFFIMAEESSGASATGGDARLWPTLKQALLRRVAGDGTREAEAGILETARLKEELRASREQIRVMLEEHESAIEELKALEEETLSSNEEFQSTNEELETAKEELQSLNEELSTANDELRFRNRELKVVLDEVAKSRDYADALFETMAEPLLVLNSELRVERANQAFYERFKTTSRETLHGHFYALGNGQWDVPALRALLEEVLPRRTTVRDYEVSTDFPHVGERTMRLNAARVAWPDHTLILLSIEDVTTRKRVLQQLTESDRQKDEFLAMLAHELRNPLAVMSNVLNVWKHDNASADMRHTALDTMERQLRNQVRMVDDLLDVSRVTRGVVALRIEHNLDLAHSVRQAHEGLRDQIAARGHDVTMALPVGGLHVDGDRTRLEQVVANLLSNAIKYTPPGGRIEVALARDGGEAVLSVADSGIGMTSAFLPQVFNVFVQADSTLDRNEGGLGIGLAVVRRLVELHGGSVEAHSAGLRQGSRFVVRLPAVPAAEVRAPPGEERDGPTRGDTATPAAFARRILVVDDNHDAAESAAEFLRLEGHEVQVVYDGQAALQAAHDFQPDAVLLDIGMPEMNGYEVCRELRSLPDQRDTLIIAASGFGQDHDLSKARDAGFDHHLIKPMDPTLLARYLREGR